jgi:hypothetical protein
MRECSDILTVMAMRLEAFGCSPGALERLTTEGTSLGDVTAAALAALVRSLGSAKVALAFERQPAT